nr:uncharacterized protein LOC117977482 [Pan paniscus]
MNALTRQHPVKDRAPPPLTEGVPSGSSPDSHRLPGRGARIHRNSLTPAPAGIRAKHRLREAAAAGPARVSVSVNVSVSAGVASPLPPPSRPHAPRTHARSQTHARGAGAAPGAAAAAAAPREAKAAPRNPEPRPGGPLSRPRPRPPALLTPRDPGPGPGPASASAFNSWGQTCGGAARSAPGLALPLDSASADGPPLRLVPPCPAACALLVGPAFNRWRLGKCGCCVPILQARQLRFGRGVIPPRLHREPTDGPHAPAPVLRCCTADEVQAAGTPRRDISCSTGTEDISSLRTGASGETEPGRKRWAWKAKRGPCPRWNPAKWTRKRWGLSCLLGKGKAPAPYAGIWSFLQPGHTLPKIIIIAQKGGVYSPSGLENQEPPQAQTYGLTDSWPEWEELLFPFQAEQF